ncbi:MAG: Gfo/Idh/MocA family oxidoreductase [Flavobacteriaceae bacterium]
MKNLNRRRFLQKTSLGTAAAVLSPSLSAGVWAPASQPNQRYMGGFAAAPLPVVRMAFIGVGYRGSRHALQWAEIEGTQIVALCDLYDDLVEKTASECQQLGKGKRHQNIATYSGDAMAWKKMLAEVDVDAVIISTNWKNHAPMAKESMLSGAHTFVEVPLALRLEELWELIDISEATQKHCMMMENVNYGRDELMYLNICRQGKIGELLHGEAAYIHELRWQMEELPRGTGSWRTTHYASRSGNLYPTHGLGPVAQYMNIARGEDLFDHMVSFSTPARGRNLHAKKNYPPEHPWNQFDFKGGDLNTSMIKTQIGRTILVQWDETSPRPYTRLNLIQGTLGTLAGYPTRVAFEGGFKGITDSHHDWIQGEALEKLYAQYEHPLYKRLGLLAKKMGGHGGMDFIMRYRIVECLRQGKPLDQNVYEGCFWSAVTPLSEQSVAENGRSQAFPDFTRGRWQNTAPLAIIN